MKQLAVDLDFIATAPTDPEEACRAWLRRHGIQGVRRGRTILVSPVDVDRVLRQDALKLVTPPSQRAARALDACHEPEHVGRRRSA